MKKFLTLAFLLALPLAAEKKPLPGRATNDQVDFLASVLLDRQEIQTAVRAEMPLGYVVVKIQVIPKTEHPIRISPDDFTLLWRKNGERAPSFSPEQIAGGGGSLALKASPRAGGGVGAQPNTNVWSVGGIGMGGGSAGNSSAGKTVEVDPDAKGKAGNADNTLLALLKVKGLPDKEITTPVEGLLYFLMDGKLKSKELSMIYKGNLGRLIIDFQ